MSSIFYRSWRTLRSSPQARTLLSCLSCPSYLRPATPKTLPQPVWTLMYIWDNVLSIYTLSPGRHMSNSTPFRLSDGLTAAIPGHGVGAGPLSLLPLAGRAQQSDCLTWNPGSTIYCVALGKEVTSLKSDSKSSSYPLRLFVRVAWMNMSKFLGTVAGGIQHIQVFITLPLIDLGFQTQIMPQIWTPSQVSVSLVSTRHLRNSFIFSFKI